MKRTALLLAILLVTVVFLPACSTKPPVTVYTDGNTDAVRKLVEPFTRSTGIPVSIEHFTSPRLLVDAVKAPSDGKQPPDVIFSTEKDAGEALLAQNTLAEFTPANAGSIPAGAHNGNLWYGMGGHVWVLAWNTGLVTAPPASLFDLAGEGYPAGSVSVINPNYILFYPCGAAATVGETAISSFLQKLTERNAQWEANPADTAKSVAEGKAQVCLTTLQEATKQKEGGAPIAWAVPDQAEGGMGAYLQFNVVGVAKVSAMPDKAKKLAEYLLSPEAEKLSVELGLSDATLQNCGSKAPVVKPLAAGLEDAKTAMQNLGMALTWFTSANPEYKGK